MLVADHGSSMPHAVVAGNCLGCAIALVPRQDSPSDMCHAVDALLQTGKDEYKTQILSVALPSHRGVQPAQKLLAQFASDNLWYAAQTRFSCSAGAWVSFAKYENEAWVERNNLRDLSSADWARLGEAGFPGLTEPDQLEQF